MKKLLFIFFTCGSLLGNESSGRILETIEIAYDRLSVCEYRLQQIELMHIKSRCCRSYIHEVMEEVLQIRDSIAYLELELKTGMKE